MSLEKYFLDFIRDNRHKLWNELFSLPFYRFIRVEIIYSQLKILDSLEYRLVSYGIGKAIVEISNVVKMPNFFKERILNMKATSD
jgi:hypothetical protein